jgi:hypothetical protein
MGGGGGSLSCSASSISAVAVVGDIGTGGDDGGCRRSLSSPNGLASSKSDMFKSRLLYIILEQTRPLGLVFSLFASVIGVSQ